MNGVECLGKGQTAIEAVPSSGMPMPLDIEAIPANPVQADEGTIELLTKVLGEAGTVTLDKAVSCAMPLAENIDWIVEFGWTDHGQEAGL